MRAFVVVLLAAAYVHSNVLFREDLFEGLADAFSSYGNSSGNSSFHPTNASCISCNSVNILLMLDSSQSIPPESYQAVKDFLADDFVPGWNIGPDDVNFAIITFYEKVDTNIPFGELTTLEEVQSTIENLPRDTGATNIELAMDAARDSIDQGKRYQPGAPTAIILFSDGSDELGNNAGSVADNIRYLYGTRIICVGIPGQNGEGPLEVDLPELDAIAGDPAYVLPLSDIDELSSLIEPIVDVMACCACYSDIVVLIETSELISNFTEQGEVVKRLAAMLDVAPKLSHLSLVSFSSPDSRSRVQWGLDDANSYNEISDRVDEFVADRDEWLGLSDIDYGLQLVLDNSFTKKGGDRAESANAVVFIGQGFYDNADNCCPDPFGPGGSAEQLRAVADVYALSVGPNVSISNLEKLTGDPDKVRTLGNYTEIAQEIADLYLDQPGCKPHPVPVCNKLDAVFIFDASGSIDNDCDHCFDDIKTFAIGVAQSMVVGPDDVQFGFMTFASEVNMKSAAQPNVYENNDDLVAAIQALPYTKGATNTASALELTRDWINEGPSAGFRDGVNQAIILLSDGESNRGDNPVTVASDLRVNYGVTIITVGVPEGNGKVDPNGFKELVAIAGDASHEFNITDLSDIDNVVADLEALLPCDANYTTTVGPPPSPVTAVTVTVDWNATTTEPMLEAESAEVQARRKRAAISQYSSSWEESDYEPEEDV